MQFLFRIILLAEGQGTSQNSMQMLPKPREILGGKLSEGWGRCAAMPGGLREGMGEGMNLQNIDLDGMRVK